MFDIFEQPWTLMGAAVLVLFGMLTFRSFCPEKRRWWQLLVPVFLAVAAFGADMLVQTDLVSRHKKTFARPLQEGAVKTLSR